MLIIDTYLNDSQGKGFGLFSRNPILKGDVYWIRDLSFDRIFDPKQMQNFDSKTISFIQYYGFKEATGNWYLCVDNARFCNHSDKANTINEFDKKGELLRCIASKDIEAGEEIVCDYRKTCISCIDQLGFLDAEQRL